jgi:hypothetical protein
MFFAVSTAYQLNQQMSYQIKWNQTIWFKINVEQD